MFLLNLSLPEFLAILGAVSGVVVALYLLSRSRRRQQVPTLKFWTQAQAPVPSTRRRRIQQPWSLLLQLLSLALLLLAIAQLKWGDPERSLRDHVLLLDASSWTGAKTAPNRIIADEVRARARQFVNSLPGSDRVMVVRADALPSPATGMESDRAAILRAIDETRPGASALDLDAAFAFAAQTRQLNRAAGDVVFIGSPRVGQTGMPATVPANLRIVAIDAASDNVGITTIGVRRSDAQPETWEILLAVRNYGKIPRRVPISVTFGGAPAASNVLIVRPGVSENFAFRLRTKAAGWIDARLLLRDGLDDDNRAILEIPPFKSLKVNVYTTEPETFRPALAALGQIEATYLAPGAYKADNDAAVVILDRFNPPTAPKVPAIWVEPPAGSPWRTTSVIGTPKSVSWRADHEICQGIRSRDLRLTAGQTLAAAADDIQLATIDSGAVALLRPGTRNVALGFHPGRHDMRFDLTAPLLLANTLRWMQPDVFRGSDLHAGSVGTVMLPVDPSVDPKTVKVLSDSTELPYTLQDGTLRFFAGSPGIVRVLTPGRERVYSLSLPEVADLTWTPPSSVRTGLPGGFGQAISRDLWQILAALGTLGLLAEWWFYGRRRIAAQTSATPAEPEVSTGRAA